MSAPDVALLPREPKPGLPVFAVPWHAEALGIANGLIQSGMYSQVEWAETLAAEIRRLAALGEPDTEETFPYQVLPAANKLCHLLGILDVMKKLESVSIEGIKPIAGRLLSMKSLTSHL